MFDVSRLKKALHVPNSIQKGKIHLFELLTEAVWMPTEVEELNRNREE